MLNFPTVYIHNWKETNDYEVYIGESNNIIQRTKQHYDMCLDKSKWQHKLLSQNASLYIIGHKTRRGYGEFKGGWEFPSGKIEEGETSRGALEREIKEELTN